jgi:hypothetical protein
MTSKHHWEGKVLIGDVKIAIPDGTELTFKDNISYSEDGKVMTAKREMNGPMGQAQMTFVMNKQQAWRDRIRAPSGKPARTLLNGRRSRRNPLTTDPLTTPRRQEKTRGVRGWARLTSAGAEPTLRGPSEASHP